MKRVLLTGMSGTGKSTVVDELAARGYKAIDADCDTYSHWVVFTEADGNDGSPVEPGRDWVWREDRIQELLSRADSDILFVSGCAPNMREFLPQFDHVILLSAPSAVIVERLATRTNNSYGKRPGEAARVLELQQTVEPLLRKIANHEIDTNKPLESVIAAILHLVEHDKTP